MTTVIAKCSNQDYDASFWTRRQTLREHGFRGNRKLKQHSKIVLDHEAPALIAMIEKWPYWTVQTKKV